MVKKGENWNGSKTLIWRFSLVQKQKLYAFSKIWLYHVKTGYDYKTTIALWDYKAKVYELCTAPARFLFGSFPFHRTAARAHLRKYPGPHIVLIRKATDYVGHTGPTAA